MSSINPIKAMLYIIIPTLLLCMVMQLTDNREH